MSNRDTSSPASIRGGRARSSVVASAAENELQVLGRFEFRRARLPTFVPATVQRLLALLAVRGGRQHRMTVAGTLWMDMPDHRAAANLRTTIWRAKQIDPRLVDATGAYLELGRAVRLDLTEFVRIARRLVTGEVAPEDPERSMQLLAGELLPEWYDDWVLLERERLRQLRLHGLEALSLRLAGSGRYADAIEVGMLAAAAEPLRESTHRALIRAHLAEGNMSEAVRQYDVFADLLREHLGIEPSDSLRRLVSPCR